MSYRSALINVMEGAARKAARGLIRDFGEVERLQVSRKGPADFVSEADRRAERAIRAELEKARPEFGFCMEESGETVGTDTTHRWVVDPLDGTTNFLHGIPHFAISIGLEENGRPIAGVILDPIKDELFWAEVGQGAHLNNHRLRVSGRTRLADSLIATGIPFHGHSEAVHDRSAQEIRSLSSHVSGIRRQGAAALDLAYVAAGRYDGYWEWALNAWDICAGIVLVREAGGMVSEIGGGDDVLAGKNILAANDQLYGALSELLRKSGQSRL